MDHDEITKRNLYLSSLFGGGIAGIFVDVVLFPLDTLTTRLQSAEGLKKSGGFHGVYKGLGPQAIGSAPQAALFFLTYEAIKNFADPKVPEKYKPAVHMLGASIAEVVACLVRIPVEVVKQRRQTVLGTKYTSLKIAMHAYKTEGLRKGLYRGFGSTITRDVPFSVIHFPLMEYLKKIYRTNFKNNISLESWEVAMCGSIAGGFSAAVTTPLDVCKTRIVLADKKLIKSGEITMLKTFKSIYRNRGIKGLFAGFVPRVLGITVGGYLFFGSYDFSKKLCLEHILEP